jgi:hypothetical protein
VSESLFRHAFWVKREKKWPFQWIGHCRCGKGIRCNSEADAREFFKQEGCDAA